MTNTTLRPTPRLIISGLCVLTALFFSSPTLAATKVNTAWKEEMRQITCIAHAIYYEAPARKMTNRDMLVIYASIHNRIKDRRHANTACKVVWQKVRGNWQYSFLWKKKLRKLPRKNKRWRRIWKFAQERYLLQHYFDIAAFPKRWSCMLWYKRVDNKATGKRGRSFFDLLRKVDTVGSHALYCLPKGGIRAVELARKRRKRKGRG